MLPLTRDLVFLVLQFLEKEKLMESLHGLEKESGLFFNKEYFDERFLAGEWDEVEKYVSGFTKLDDNNDSMQIFYDIRKQKYLEALDRKDKAKALEILVQDLRVFSTTNEEVYKELTQMVTLDNFRENDNFSTYGDIKNARSRTLVELTKHIKANPLFRDKLVFPNVESLRLQTLINQSYSWQHMRCKHPRPNPDFKTLLTDHTCGPPSPVNQPVAILTYPAPSQQTPSLEDLPTKAVLALYQGSPVTSMDFHPVQHTLLLVGSATGEITLWELVNQERLVSRSCTIWDSSNSSIKFQGLLAPISVTRVTWSPLGNFIGVAFTKHLIHLYTFSGHSHLRQLTEIDAHVGAVNDLAFAKPYKKLCIVTCGDDKLVKVWDLSGRKHFTFEGHTAPVYSICPHYIHNTQFVFSTDIDGKIKAWLYDNLGSRVDYVGPPQGRTTMRYSSDGTRLFSCGTSKYGNSFLVEWKESAGTIKRVYLGFMKKLAGGVAQFDTSKNRFLAVGEDGEIKFWDMGYSHLLTTASAEGGLGALPRLRFNWEGNLLAVTTADNGFKILANPAGLRSLRVRETPADFTVPNALVGSPVGTSPILSGVDPSDSRNKPKSWPLAEFFDPSQCCQVTLPNIDVSSTKIVGLLYTNSGTGILALGSNGILRLWKWVCNENNPSGKATANDVPQHWQPNDGLLMTNDVSRVNLEEASPCIAVTNNDSFVLSAVGGRCSVFTPVNCKVLTTFQVPPPASTFLTFMPQDNNIIAIGLEDSMIYIYDFTINAVRSMLKGHQKRITGLTFSTILNVMVSSGADAWICFWSAVTWEKRKAVALQMPAGKAAIGDTRVEFHVDHVRVLAVHETQLAIFDASKMECIQQWVTQDHLSAPISSAVYSCNSKLIYTAFRDGNIGVFEADTLRLRCRILPSAYLPQGNQGLSPHVVAAHPQEPNQFAVGLNDGSIKVIEPTEADQDGGQIPLQSYYFR